MLVPGVERASAKGTSQKAEDPSKSGEIIDPSSHPMHNIHPTTARQSSFPRDSLGFAEVTGAQLRM